MKEWSYEELLTDDAFISALRLRLSRESCLWGDPKRLFVHETANMVNTLYNTGSGTITVGEYSFTGHNVCLLAGKHIVTESLADRKDHWVMEGDDIVIGKGVWIASNSVVLGPCEIRDHAVVAAGSVVLPHTVIPSKSMYAGIPAKFIKTLAVEDSNMDAESEGSTMNHKRVDRIMKEVEDIYLGDFSVNGDEDLTRRLSRRLREQNQRRFRTAHVSFDVNRMFCTEECSRKDDRFQVPKGGSVYGPYWDFPMGEYDAEFYIHGEVSGCTLCAANQELGTISSVEVAEVAQDGIYRMTFLLERPAEAVELKLYNPEGGTVYFEKVCVRDCGAENTAQNESHRNAASVSATAGGEDLLTALTEELGAERRTMGLSLNALSTAAECSLPARSPLRAVKEFFRKLLNSYIVFQVDFNRNVVQLFHVIFRQLDTIRDGFALTALHLREQDEALETLTARTKEIDHLQAQLSKQAEKIDVLGERTAEIERLHSQLNELTGKLEVLSTQSENLEQLYHRLDEQDNKMEALTVRNGELEQAHSQACKQEEKINVLSAQCEEIGHLWNKVREFDQNFEGIWAHDREVNTNLNSVWQTYNTMRQELFYEINHRAQHIEAASAAEKQEPELRPTAAKKIAAAGGAVRLNLGSGNLGLDGYLNVDARPLPNVDIVADVMQLPYKQETVDEIFSAHLIEHFTMLSMEKELLPYWHALLKKDGVLRVVFPDLEAMIDAYKAGDMTFEQLGKVIMGGQDYQLDYHYAVYSPDTVTGMLERAGYRDIQIVTRGRENGGCKETEIRAVK